MALPIALCADDFGLSTEIDAAILALIAAGRLTATSVMVAGPHAAEGAQALLDLSERADIGLHLSFTDLPSLTPLPHAVNGLPPQLGALLVQALTGRLDRRAIRDEIDRQVERFRALFGRAPDFIDGHQHVHVLPAMRAAIFAAFADGTLDRARTWMRVPCDPLTGTLGLKAARNKALVVAILSAGLAARARRAGVRTNGGFRGYTDFRHDGSYGDVLAGQLAGMRPATLFMCHPALPGNSASAPDAGAADGIAAARVDEYAYLASDRFGEDLARSGLALERMSRILG